MNPPTTNDPVARLDRLEREAADLKERLKRTTGEVHLLQWMLVLVIAAAVGVPYYFIQNGTLRPDILFDKSVSKALDAQEIGLHNRNGKRVMFADYDKFGLPYQLFFDLDMKCKMGLYMTGGNPELTLYNRAGTGTRASFHMTSDGEARLELLGEKQKGGIILSTAEDGTPRLRMTDASGKVLFEAPPPTAGQNPAPGGPGNADPKGPHGPP